MRRRFPLRIILLAAGVLFGFGSAFAHSGHWHDHYRHRHDRCHQDDRPCPRDCR